MHLNFREIESALTNALFFPRHALTVKGLKTGIEEAKQGAGGMSNWGDALRVRVLGAAARSRHAPVLKTTWRTASPKDASDIPAAIFTSCFICFNKNISDNFSVLFELVLCL